MPKPRILIYVEYYLPGYRAGGPMRSVSALVEQLGGEFDFYVVTRDRDAGGAEPYPESSPGAWVTMGKARVLYLAPHEMSASRLVAAVRQVDAQLVYLNSLFASMSLRLLVARRLGALPHVPIVLAPRGELSPGALRLKARKKRSALRLLRWTRLHRDVIFHASTERERDEISRALPTAQVPLVARNPMTPREAPASARSKTSGSADFVFLSRVSRKKNLHLAIELLRSVEGAVTFDIFGPVVGHADEVYWRECNALVSGLPANVTVNWRGPVPHELVASTLAAHHFFLFPTAGENFGHAIVEALLAGCPTLTSDQTPWTGLEQHGAGWDLPLEDTATWRQRLQTCVDMDASTYAQASARSQAFGRRVASADTAAANLDLFESVLGQIPCALRNSPVPAQAR